MFIAPRHEFGFLFLTLAALSVLSVFAMACSGGSAGVPGSLGAVLGRDNETHALYVRDVPEGLAADVAGLFPGDEIVMIDGVYVRDLDKQAITQKLRGDVGTFVNLTVLRVNEVRRMRIERTPLRGPDAVVPKEERLGP